MPFWILCRIHVRLELANGTRRHVQAARPALARRQTLLPSSNTPRHRKQFPQDFPKAIHRERLTARTLPEAKAQVRRKWAELEARFQQLRNPPKTHLPDCEAQRILAAALASRVGADEEERLAGMDEWAINRHATALAECDRGAWGSVARRGDARPTRKGAGLLLGPTTTSLSSRPITAHSRSSSREWGRRHEHNQGARAGEFVDTPPPPAAANSAPADSTKAPLFSEVVDYFIENYDDRKPMYRKHTAVLPLLREFIGATSPSTRSSRWTWRSSSSSSAGCLRGGPMRCGGGTSRVKELAALEHPKTLAPKTFEDTYVASVRPFLASARRLFGDRGFPGYLTTEGIQYRGKVKDRREQAARVQGR